MTHLDIELKHLKTDIMAMWKLVSVQLQKTKQALLNFDKDLAREIILNEKRVNAYELKIDRDCENIFALFNPVAVDLRFVLAVLKINNNLERTGDIAEGIARFVVSADSSFDEQLIETAKIVEMFEVSDSMLQDVLIAFDNDDTKLARSSFEKDELLDAINHNANEIITAYIKKNSKKIGQGLYILSTIRKMERVGDQVKNIAEEIIFSVEAKVTKHSERK